MYDFHKIIIACFTAYKLFRNLKTRQWKISCPWEIIFESSYIISKQLKNVFKLILSWKLVTGF